MRLVCSLFCSPFGKSPLMVLQKGMVLLVSSLFSQNSCAIHFCQTFYYLLLFVSDLVGIIEANFIEPAHDKQDFERSSVFVRLEARLKQILLDYWFVNVSYL